MEETEDEYGDEAIEKIEKALDETMREHVWQDWELQLEDYESWHWWTAEERNLAAKYTTHPSKQSILDLKEAIRNLY